MAEVEATTGTETIENQNQDVAENQDNLTRDQLIEELAKARTEAAQANADRERFKNSVNDLTRKNGELTKQVRERMSADEQAQEAEKERVNAIVAENAEFKSKFRMMEYTNEYMEIGMDKQTASNMASLTGEIPEPDKFFSALDKFVKAVSKKAGESAVETLIKNNPSVNAGNGDNGGESLAVRKAKELVKGRNGGINQDILKNFM